MTADKVRPLRAEPPRADGVDMPTTVLVGPKTYDVIVDAETFARLCFEKQDYEMSGYLDRQQQTIYVAAGLAGDTSAEHLLHEVLHTALDGLTPTDLPADVEERVVNLLGGVILQVVRDNPDLVAYLRGQDV